MKNRYIAAVCPDRRAHFVQLVTVDGKRHGLTEADVTECGTFSFVFVSDVKAEDANGDLRTKIDCVVAASLTVKKGRCRSKL